MTAPFKVGDRVMFWGQEMKVELAVSVHYGPRLKLRSVEFDDVVVHTLPDNVERIEPPVNVFKAGDIVQHRNSPDRYLIGRDGYYSFQYQEWRTPVPEFTSGYYTLIEVPE